jgi:predicted chitinase
MINRETFFGKVRSSLFSGSLSQKQVDGMNYMLDAYEAKYEKNWPDLRWISYCFATAYHETAYTMQPISEYGGQSYLQSKPYYPYYGRGYVQLTWEDNYRKMGQKLGIDLLGANKERALEPAIAAEVMYSGMRDGDFTSKRLSSYFTDALDDPVNARRIINGTDRAETIAGYHRKFLEAFQAAYTAEAPAPTPEPEQPAPTEPEEPAIPVAEFRTYMAEVNRLADALINKHSA